MIVHVRAHTLPHYGFTALLHTHTQLIGMRSRVRVTSTRV
jgi:hypothetical protein